MVYQGRPSRGCGTCRQRRVKCDERKPTCFRCEKARRTCTGYRPEFEIVHRSENRALERRMRTVVEKEAPIVRVNAGSGIWIQTTSGNWNLTVAESSSSPPSDRSLSPTLSISIEEQASCHFAANFILIPLQGSPEGYYEFLLPLVASEPPKSALRHAFRACAYASLGGTRRTDGVDVTEMAMRNHTEALNQTHVALGNPAAAKSDAVLATVLLLCLFENMMATKETGMLAWRSHIEGAVQILKSRGQDQQSTKNGRRLFNAVRHQLVARALSSGVGPIAGLDWWAGTNSSSMQAACQSFSLRTSQLRAEVSRLMTSVKRDQASIDLMLEMARRVQVTDQEIATWLFSLPEEYRFKTLCWQEYPTLESLNLREADVFPGRVDVYPDFIIAEAWNMARASRLILASLSIRLTAWISSPVDYRTTPEYATSKRICEGTITDMIASVPYHLGWHTRRKELFASPELLGFACGEDVGMKTLPVSFIVWPLASIHAHDMATDDQRAWCNGRLRYIGNELGLKYAHLLADAKIRYPSMMIQQDGLMPSPDPLRVTVGEGLKVPRSPSRSPSQSP